MEGRCWRPGVRGSPKMRIIDEQGRPTGTVPIVRAYQVERPPKAIVLRLLGYPVAYLPHSHRVYYNWALAFTYRPAQFLSAYQYEPSSLKVHLLGRYELGVILKEWRLGLRLGRKPVWVRRLEPVPIAAQP